MHTFQTAMKRLYFDDGPPLAAVSNPSRKAERGQSRWEMRIYSATSGDQKAIASKFALSRGQKMTFDLG